MSNELLDVALAIADGTPVEWQDAGGSGAGRLPNPHFARQLRELERLVRGHDEMRVSIPHQEAHRPIRFTEGLDVRWGPLIVREKLGHGSFGDVYRAWDPRIEREVALKIVVDALEDQRPVIEEARRLARVAHPNVLAVYGAERIDGRAGIWMQYVRGRTLDEEVRERGPLAPDDVIRIGIEVARAIGAVHAAGLVHGDIKARNVLRGIDGRILLCDFGASVDLDATDPGAPGLTAGTPLYLAPEILNGIPPSCAGDFYSLGVLLYFLASGTYPVRGRTVSEIREAHAHGRRLPLDAERPALPAPLVVTVNRLLRNDPSERPADAALVERDLTSPAASHATVWKWVSLAVVLTTAALVTSWWFALSGTAPTIGTRAVLGPPCWSTVSVSGWMACGKRAGQAQSLVLFRPESNTQRTIEDVPGEIVTEAVISPDGRRVAYSLQTTADQRRPDRVRVVDVNTGVDRLVAELPPDLELASVRAWWPHADALEMYVRRPGMRFSLERLDIESGHLETVFDFPADPQGHATSPDGRLLAFDVRGDNGARDIRVCRLDDKTCVTVTSNPADDFRPFWSPDGALLFTSSRSGAYGVWRVTGDVFTSPNEPSLVKDLGRDYLVPRGFDANGRFYYDLVGNAIDLSIARLDRRRAGASIELERVSRDPTSSGTAPDWSAGEKLVYLEVRGPFAEADKMSVVIESPTGAVERQIPLVARSGSSHLAWSPDGRRVAFSGIVGDAATANSTPAIHLFDAESGAAMDVFQPRASAGPIGWIGADTVAYALGKGIGAYDFAQHQDRVVWVAPPAVRVTSVAVSRDGQRIAVTAVARDGSGWMIFVLPTADAPPTAEPLLSAPKWIQAHDWMPSGRALLVSQPSATAPAPAVDLVSHPLDSGPEQVLLRGIQGLIGARISGDGARLAVVVKFGVRHEISMELPK